MTPQFGLLLVIQKATKQKKRGYPFMFIHNLGLTTALQVDEQNDTHVEFC